MGLASETTQGHVTVQRGGAEMGSQVDRHRSTDACTHSNCPFFKTKRLVVTDYINIYLSTR